MAKAQTKWTQHEIYELRRLLKRGLTQEEIAVRLQRSYKSVQHRIGLEPDLNSYVKGAKAAALAAHLIPKPYRHDDFTARFCGDPPPDRSALAQRQAQR